MRSWQKAADRDLAGAQYNLGACYAKVEGVPKSFKEAVRWYRKAAEQGDADAQFDPEISYFEGKGVPRSLSGALMWYNEAAARGEPCAVEAEARMTSINRASQGGPPPSKAADLDVCTNGGISGDSEGAKLNSCSQCKAVKYCEKACQMKHACITR